MKHSICIIIGLGLLLSSTSVLAAAARCEVVRKQGNVLIMDCGDQAKGFQEKSQVKIKTDRAKK